jgi:outer membrane lipoprotein SlyB
MSDSIDTILKGLLQRYGIGLLEQTGRLKSLLQDEAPAAKREISVLLLALDERVPQDLMRVHSGEPLHTLRPRLAKRLADEKALDREASEWAVSVWALGLGVASPDDGAASSVLPEKKEALTVGFMGTLPENAGAGTQGAAAANGTGTATGSWLSRNKWLAAGAVAIAAIAAYVLIPGTLEITDVHTSETLVGDGKKRDVIVQFRQGSSPVQAVQVRHVRGAGPWTPDSWTTNVAAEASSAGRAGAGPISVRSTKPLTTTFEYTLVAKDGTRSKPFEKTFDIAAAPVQPPSIGAVDVRGPVYAGRPIPVNVSYQSGTSDVAKVEVKQVEGSGGQGPITQNVTGTSGKTSGTLSQSLPAINTVQRAAYEIVLVDTQGVRSEPKVVAFDVTQAPASVGRSGVVIRIQEVAQSGGETSGVGSVVGGIVGGVLGHQVGSGRGNTVATVAGAVGGAVAGNLIEKNANTKKVYQVHVRFDDGKSQVFNANGYPSLRTGDRVRVVNGVLQTG